MTSPHKQFLVLLVLPALLSLGACKKTAAPVEQSASTTASPDYQHAQGGTTPVGETKHFKGSIGSTLGLQMKLLRESDKLTGNYFYQKVGTKIDVRGTVDKDGNVMLEEFDPKGNKTGIFAGLWKIEADGLIGIAGNWNKPNSDKKTAFSLHEEPIAFSGAVEIAAKHIKENNKKLKYEIAAEYPQLTGSTDPNFEKFNQATRALVLRKVSDFRKDMAPQPGEEASLDSPDTTSEGMGSDLGIGYSVALAKDDLISIEFSVGSYYQGAAHPNSYSEVVNFDLKNGKPIRLADIFKPGSKFLQAISTYSIQDLKKQSTEKLDSLLDDDWIQRGAGPKADNYKNWSITQKGLVITFDSYQVGPYAAGSQKVLVPYAALKDIIKPDGPVGQFVK